MNKKFPHFFASLVGILLLVGCSRGTHELVFRPANDTHYNLTYKIGGEVEINMLGSGIKQPVNTEIDCVIKFDTLPNGKTAASFSYNNYWFDKAGIRPSMNTDSLQQKDSIANEVFETLRTLSFHTVMSQKGQTEKKHATDSIWKVVEASLAPLDEKVRVQLAAALRPLINDDMMGTMLEQCFYILPGKKVDVGDKWTNQIRMKSIFTMLLVNEFELKSVKNGVAEIAVVSKVSNADNQVGLPGLAIAGSPAMGQPDAKKGFDLMGMKLDAAFNGTQQGTFYVDMGTGLMQNGKMQQQLEGNFKIGSMEIPMKLNLKNEYRNEKI
jgi:uncharacterized protein YcfL